MDEETKLDISNRNYKNSNERNGLNNGFNQSSLSISSFKNNNDIQNDFPIPSRPPLKSNKISNLEQMFFGCISLILVPDISKLDISQVKSLNGLFFCCDLLDKYYFFGILNHVFYQYYLYTYLFSYFL